MSRRWRHCGITQTLIRVFVRGQETRAAHPSSRASILLPPRPLISAPASAWQPYFLPRVSPLPPCRLRPLSATSHSTRIYRPSFLFLLRVHHRSQQRFAKWLRSSTWNYTESPPPRFVVAPFCSVFKTTLTLCPTHTHTRAEPCQDGFIFHIGSTSQSVPPIASLLPPHFSYMQCTQQ